MTLIELIRHLMPDGTDAYASSGEPSATAETAPITYQRCPTWPVDLFAVIGTIIERSGCYTLAGPVRDELPNHATYLATVAECARTWNSDISQVPALVEDLWQVVTDGCAKMQISEVRANPALVKILVALFAIADEACAGMGWDVDPNEASARKFSSVAFAALTKSGSAINLPHEPVSLCVMVPPDRAVVLPKSITSSVGCTIRSLSHYLALLPPSTVLEPQWFLSSKGKTQDDQDASTSNTLRLLLVPFPFEVHANSFKLSFPRTALGSNHVPAYFELEQRWLDTKDGPLTGQRLADELIIPLIKTAAEATGQVPNGIILPECALTSELAGGLVNALVGSGIEFLITGVLDTKDGKHLNRALTFAIQRDGVVAMAEQNKHHRWRLDRGQTERYSLHFDDSLNNKWWEDIDVSQRKLPFFGLRKDMSLATLICEDLARTDPAMTAIRAVGPNLVVALLMDGPQLAVRWPGRYATVLAEDPGSAVLSFTCAAMVDRSNLLEARPTRAVGLWRDGTNKMQEILLPEDALGMVLTLQSKAKHQNTLDNRSDNSLSRQLTLRAVEPLFLAGQPDWI
ncbi:hypothetical protein IP91_00185 [Pseudoduganella lurida]|uniref:Uncharacterized protein n=1 Tax=Pseudoduganella lurida TaxID=1036180 RepID=A0A562RJ70_9BURK|nr:hypothetical protein [Pseudoduganella lurida]TWI69119.1 hypothetical protein IP91_00185 [Pseudoduganella lurida]